MANKEYNEYTIINDISLAEKVEKQEEKPVEVASAIASATEQTTTNIINEQPIAPVAPSFDSNVIPSPISPVPVAAPVAANDAPSFQFNPFLNANSQVDNYATNMQNNNPLPNTSNFGISNNSFDLNAKSNLNNNLPIENSSIYKDTNAVDKALDAYIEECKKLYIDKISEPTKTAVEVANRAMNLVKTILENGGINLELFKEYESLQKMYSGIKEDNFGKKSDSSKLNKLNEEIKTNNYEDSVFGKNYNDDSYSASDLNIPGL